VQSTPRENSGFEAREKMRKERWSELMVGVYSIELQAKYLDRSWHNYNRRGVYM
jgi:hypothetical protein